MRELYQFKIGATYYTFTSGLMSYTFSGRVFKPTTITRSSIKKTANNKKNGCTIIFKNNEPFAVMMLHTITEEDCYFSLYRDEQAYFNGYVTSVKYTGRNIEISCDTTVENTKAARLQEVMSPTCRHTLYNSNCTINQDSYRSTYSGVLLNSITVTIPAITQPTGYFTGGIIEHDGKKQYIKKHAEGGVLTLGSQFTEIYTGSVNLYPGCALTESECLTKFNNIINFGGFARIPNKDPYGPTGVL